uniref:excinuclease ABC subunit A n=1 Tax=Clostridium sp. TaxID=1506 RepID=UPI0026397C6D
MKCIEVVRAKENNLNNIDLDIELDKITVVTGVSGSGKSSLVFDTIYAESERMFLESMSINVNNISSRLKRPDVYKIKNLLPSIAISQKQTNRNPRSTIGTVTDISPYIRLLFSKIANIEDNKMWSEGDFSYNNPRAWCEKCKGIGEEYIVDIDKVIDKNKSINDGGILYWNETNKDYYSKLIKEVSNYYNINLDIPLCKLDTNKLEFILKGKSDEKFSIRFKNYKNKYRSKIVGFEGVLRELDAKLEDIDTPSTLKSIQKFLIKSKCSKCKGTRLKIDRLKYEIYNKNIYDMHSITIGELKKWINSNISKKGNVKDKIFEEIGIEIEERITNLEKVKLGYLSLDRSVPTLSGGESQRIRLANQLSCGLSGILYVLDEPTMGLHINDIKNICEILIELKARGNTILLVEHNAEVMLSADKIVEIGPRGGINGGNIVFNGLPADIVRDNKSLTGKYLNTYKDGIEVGVSRKIDKFIEVQGAKYNNIIDENFIVPLNELVVITGVSGSGKSTFTNYILEPSLSKKVNINCKSVIGFENINKVIKVDQAPIGRSPKSNIATYTGIFDLIRDIFAKTTEAKNKKITKSEFSFNVDGGRCPKCQGDGTIKVDMSFMPDTYIECYECHGRRYKEPVLDIKYNGKDISEVLNMTVIEAYEFFKSTKKISSVLECLIDVGLDYAKIGQSALTIS